jgi:hypothetical protein
VVADFDLQFSPDELPELAARFSYADDSACRVAGSAARKRGHYDRDEFLLVCKWTTVRSRPKAEANTARWFRTGRARGLALRSCTLSGVPPGRTPRYTTIRDVAKALDVSMREVIETTERFAGRR